MRSIAVLLLAAAFNLSVLGAAYSPIQNNPINVKDLGAKGDGVTDDSAAITAGQNHINTFGGCLFFPRGTYLYTNTLKVMHRDTTLLGEGPASRLKYMGTGTNAVWIGEPPGGVAPYQGLQNVRVAHLMIGGNAGTRNALVLCEVHRSKFEQLRLTDCTGAALLIQGCVINMYDHISVASDDWLFDVTPETGVHVMVSPDGQQSFDSTFRNIIISHLSGTGIRLESCQLMSFTGGGVEYCGSGIDIPSSCQVNSFKAMDLEFNRTNDFTITGHNNLLMANGCYGTNWISGRANTLIGGNFQRLHIFAGASRTLLVNVSYGYTSEGAFVDEGSDTQRLGIWNGFSDQFNVLTGLRMDELHARNRFWGGVTTLTNMYDGQGVALGTNHLYWRVNQDGYGAGIWNQGTNVNSHALGLRADGGKALTVVGSAGDDRVIVYGDGRIFAPQVTAVTLVATNFFSAGEVNIGPGGNTRVRVTIPGYIQFNPDSSGPFVGSGGANPEGVVAAEIGSVWLRTDLTAEPQLYVKTSGSGNTGWVGLSTGAGGVLNTVVNTNTVALNSIAKFNPNSTNLAAATSGDLQAAIGNVYQGTNATLTALGTNTTQGTGAIPLMSLLANLIRVTGTPTNLVYTLTPQDTTGSNWVATPLQNILTNITSLAINNLTASNLYLRGTPIVTNLTTWTAHSAVTNFVVDVSAPSYVVAMAGNMYLLHSTNGTANFVAGNSLTTEIELWNSSGGDLTLMWPATWKTGGTVATNNPITVTNGTGLLVRHKFSGRSTSQTNNLLIAEYTR